MPLPGDTLGMIARPDRVAHGSEALLRFAMLFGRADACARVDSLVATVRQGVGGALAVRGPAGIGKTTVLEYAADCAADLQVLRAQGSPAEAELPYAGLSQLLAPVLDLLPSLTAPQADALQGALALAPPSGSDVFAVYAGTVGLLAAAAARQATVVIVDDSQWLDRSSLDALLFAGRRLVRDPIIFFVAERLDPSGASTVVDLPTVELHGLDSSSAAALAAERGTHIDDHVLEWLVRATGGNPLALVDLPTYVKPDELTALALRGEPAPVGPVLMQAYGQTLSHLPPHTQHAVLIAAVLDDTTSAVLERALANAGVLLSALEAAEDAGLLDVANGVVRIRHPLIRAAVIQRTAVSARRAAHRAAAEGLTASRRPADQDSRIWHLADAAFGINEPVAELLESLALTATARTGYSAASMAYQRAAELSEPGAHKVRRLLGAAETAATAGRPEDSQRVLNLLEGELTTDSPRTAAAINHLKGRLRTWAGDPPGAAHQLQAGAEEVRHIDPRLAIGMSLDAAVAAVLSGHMQQAAAASELLTDIAGQLGGVATPIAQLLAGSIEAMRGAGDNARDILDRCRPAFEIPDPPTELLQQLVYFATEYSIVNALEDAQGMFDRAINLARQRGAIGILPFALAMSATNEYRLGSWDSARAQAAEAETLANDTGRTTDRPNAVMAKAMVDAARGREQARDGALSVIREAAEMGAGFIEAQGFSILGLLELSVGKPDAAIAPLERCRQLSTDFGLFELGHLQWAAELIEARMRTGETAAAATVLDIMRAAAHPHATRLNRALLARCEGLISTDDRWEDHFCQALSLHTGTDTRPFELARTELCFGERLRRNRRRKDAREHLERAWQLFSDLGAQPWAHRASTEIQATGKPPPRSSPHTSDLLTPQEYQVAVIVASGATNREVANALFLSQKTVEFHLSSTDRRLGIRSRSERAKIVAGSEPVR